MVFTSQKDINDHTALSINMPCLSKAKPGIWLASLGPLDKNKKLMRKIAGHILTKTFYSSQQHFFYLITNYNMKPGCVTANAFMIEVAWSPEHIYIYIWCNWQNTWQRFNKTVSLIWTKTEVWCDKFTTVSIHKSWQNLKDVKSK